MSKTGKSVLSLLVRHLRILVAAIFLLGFMPAPALAADNGILDGQVTDNTSTPISGVTILVFAAGSPTPDWSTNTSGSGNYSIVVPVGNSYMLSAMKAGYVTTNITSQNVTVNATTTVNFILPSQPPPPDTTPPAAITNLTAINPGSNNITLTWTAPGDDDATGTASQYNIRYAISIISDNASFNAATPASNIPLPHPAGTTENFTVTGLSANITYFFAIKTRDDMNLHSGLSNSPQASTLLPPSIMITHISGKSAFTLGAGDNTTEIFNITSINNFAGTVQLFFGGAPPGIQANSSLNPSQVTLTTGETRSVTLNLNASADTASGTYFCMLVGQATGIQPRVYDFAVNVGVAGMPLLWSSPPVVAAGGQTTFFTSKFTSSANITLKWDSGPRVGQTMATGQTSENGTWNSPPMTDNGVFSKEEKLLLDAVAERLGAIAEHGQAEENIIIERNLGMLLSATNSLQKVFKYCLEAAITVSEMDCGGIYSVDKKIGTINLVHHQGLSPEFIKYSSHYDADSPNAHLVMAGKPVYVQYQEMGLPLNDSLRREGLLALAVVPIKYEGEVIACINVASHTRDTIPPLGRDCLETIAAQVGSIIARISVEDALRQSEEKFSKAFRTIPDMITIASIKSGTLIEVNDSFTRLTGYSREEMLGRSALELDIWTKIEDRNRMLQILEQKGRVKNEEFQFRTKSGELRDVLVSAERIDVAGEPCLIAITTDVTEQKQSQELLQSVYHSSPMGIYIVQDDKLQYTNLQLQSITGFSKPELLGRELLSLVAIEDIDVVKSSMVFTLQEASPYPCEYRIINKTGQIKWVMQTVSPIHYKGREAILGSLMDITERKYLERKVIEYEELSKMKSDLLATVSHELRTPLATIKGYSTMILDYFSKLTSDETKEYLKSIDNSTDRLAKLVDNLLDTSRLEAGLLNLEKTPVSLTQLIQGVAAEASIRDNQRHVFTTAGKRLPKVNIDAKRIRQVLDNLIDNAIKYSPPGTEIMISGEQSGNELLVSVNDHGPGIPSEELTNIFDRMYRIEQRVYSGANGMGLGLYICQRLVAAHGGRIWAESTMGQGSTIKFTLPITNNIKGVKQAARSFGSER